MKPLAYRAAGPPPLPPESDAPPSIFFASARRTPAAEPLAQRRLLGEPSSQVPLYLRCCPTLSWDERLMGFRGCFAIGLAVSLTSMFSFVQLLAGDPAPFAWKYSIGNVLAIASSGFLVGPRSQLEKMASPLRLGATLLYLASIALTLIAALVLRYAPLTMLCIVAQFCALAWYCASYIPFGRTCLVHCTRRWCCTV